MYAINPSKLPRIASWQQAKDFWEQAKPLKINPDQRFLVSPRDLSKLVIRHPGEAYTFRYHQTDVVTYHPDGRLVIKPWRSTSTALFARRLCPSYLNIEGSSGTRHRNAFFRVNNCRTTNEFVVDTFKERLLPETLEVDYRVIRVSNKDGEYTKLARRFVELRTAHEVLAGRKFKRFSSSVPVNEWRQAARQVELDWLSVLYEFMHRLDDDIITAGLILDRAIVREPIPFGEPVKRTKYSYLWQVVEELPPGARKTMHTAPMSDSQGEFAEFKTQPDVPCRKCGVHAVSMREWESSCGGWEDYQYKCHHCGHTWWVEGIDA